MAKTNAICAIDGCNKVVFRKIWCSAHYGRWKRNGDPLAGRTTPGEPLKFFETVVATSATDECIRWPYGLDGKGYGRVWDGKTMTAVHRMACAVQNGICPDETFDAAHGCNNKWCVNPRHLRWATKSENALDRVGHDTHIRGERNPGAKLRINDVVRIKRLKGKMSNAAIAREYGVSPAQVCRILNGKKWGWVKAPA